MQVTTAEIRTAEPRDRIQVTLPDNQVLEGPIGTTTGEFLEAAEKMQPYPAPLVACICNHQLRELSYPLFHDSTLEPVTLASSDGGRVYRRSLVLLLITAAEEIWPGSKISVRHAVPDGGFFCTRMDSNPFTPQELEQLETHMRQIIREDSPITKRVVPLDEAVQLFTGRDDDDKVRLLEQRIRPELTLYTLRGRDDYYYGYMLPSTGKLGLFRLIWVRDGFILQYPRKEHPGQLRPIRTYEKLSLVFHQTDEWLQHLRVEDIGRLNRIVDEENRLHELVLVAEALHEQNIASIADNIRNQHSERGVRLILIAGPSSSGKTTFAKRLAIQLLAHGVRPFTLELDNFFVDRDLTPRDENGDYDFESLEAVRLDLFNEHLVKLIEGQEVQLPSFDFRIGKSGPGRIVQLREEQVIIIEGIHGLNPNLVPDVSQHLIYRVYVSALTQLNVDSHNRVPTTDVRLIRRIVRDARTRGWTASDTLGRWQSVRRGEKRNIFPYQENADTMFNSTLVYELAALRPLAEPLLLQVRVNTPEHLEAKRLLSFLGWVRPMQAAQQEFIPDTSLLREFIGKSSLDDYHPGQLD